jgi:hypothetical protein
MAKAQHVCLDEILGYFDELEDPRASVNLKHPLVSVVVIAMLAVLAGASGPTAIAKWAALKEELLVSVLALPNGIPRKDVFRRVLCLLRPQAFQACFANWLQSLRARAAEATGVELPSSPWTARRRGAATTVRRAWELCTVSVSGPVTSACRWGRSPVRRSPTIRHLDTPFKNAIV